MPSRMAICFLLQPAARRASTLASRSVSIGGSLVADVEFVLRAVREHAGAGALHRGMHLVLAAHERARGAVGASDALAVFAGDPGRLAGEYFARVLHLEAALAGHHVGDGAGDHAGLGREL